MKSKASKKKTTPRSKPKPKPPKKLRHDTPLDLPTEALAFDPRAAAAQALARVRRLETIEAAYDAWQDLRLEHSGLVSKLAGERKQLEQQGEFLVGAVRAARDLSSAPSVDEALALAKKGGGLDSFVVETAGRLAEAKASLQQRSADVEAAFGDAFTKLREEVRARVSRTLLHVKPRMRLMIRAIGPQTRILHVARVQPDEALLLAWVLLQKLPSRYGFLFDDSTDDATREPPMLYAEEGVSSGALRPSVAQVHALVHSKLDVLPIKGVIPFLLPRTDGPAQLTRLVERGPVMEVELADGPVFRNVLTRDEAERVAGFFLKLKLEQKIEIELVNGS